MLVHPDINPVAFTIPFFFGWQIPVRWYGLMYLTGFLVAWWLGTRRIAAGHAPVTRQQFDDMLFFSVLGVIIGGRLGHLLFYVPFERPQEFLANPLKVFAVWEGGMSFHGGLLGVMLAMFFYARRQGIGYLRMMDFVAPVCPLGLGAGRLGNFLNGELWGRVTDLPWGMVFRGAGNLPRHPSQLYELALEGIVLFVILWWFSAKARPTGQVSGLFLLGYGAFRFLAEFTREPDSFIGILALGMTWGQWLSVPMIGFGLWLLVRKPQR
jgi:phosphatidylglycerol---prolipoprotein diacylglyceryl transferase